MAVIMDQPLSSEYLDPLTSYVMGMGLEDEMPGLKRMDLMLHEAGVDHRGMAFWRLRMADFETGRTMATAALNSEGVCTISRISVGGDTRPIAKLHLGLETMYSYEYPFACMRKVEEPATLAEFHRKAWGVWMNGADGREVASYVMSTSEQCRLCCVGTVTSHEYEMGFDCDGGHVADVQNDLLGDRLYSTEQFSCTAGPVDRVLAKIMFHPDADLYGRTLCMITLTSLACYNMVTFFNPKCAPPKRRKRRR